MKQESYPKTLKGNQSRKREEAQERQNHWANLSPKQQLIELDKRPGECRKQRARILSHMNK